MKNSHPQEIFQQGFDTPAIRMLPYWRVRFLAPEDEVDALFDRIIEVVPLVYGKTDRNAIRAAPCYEYYRPMEGTPRPDATGTDHRGYLPVSQLLRATDFGRADFTLADTRTG